MPDLPICLDPDGSTAAPPMQWLSARRPRSSSRCIGGSIIGVSMMPSVVARHVGLRTDPGRFIRAYERLGVIEEPLTELWRRRIAFAFLFARKRDKDEPTRA
jgi:hypothetical protein